MWTTITHLGPRRLVTTPRHALGWQATGQQVPEPSLPGLTEEHQNRHDEPPVACCQVVLFLMRRVKDQPSRAGPSSGCHGWACAVRWCEIRTGVRDCKMGGENVANRHAATWQAMERTQAPAPARVKR